MKRSQITKPTTPSVEILPATPPQGKPGRPTLLNDALIESISNQIRQGVSVASACRSCRISREVFYDWLDPRMFPGELYEKFRAEVDQAQGESKASAEAAVFRNKPDLWLTRGPGRSQANDPDASFVAEERKVAFETKEPLRVAHAVVHQTLPQAKPNTPQLEQDDIAKFLSLSKDERTKVLAELAADLNE